MSKAENLPIGRFVRPINPVVENDLIHIPSSPILDYLFLERSMAAQIADIIWMDGEKMDLYSNPLEEYFVKRKKRRPEFYSLDVCRRGYIATWEIKDNQLYLTALEGDVESGSFFGKKRRKCAVTTLFRKAKSGVVKADWFSGKLRIPRGNMTQYEDTGYDSRFEREIIITVDHGDVIKARTLDYTQRTLVVHNQ